MKPKTPAQDPLADEIEAITIIGRTLGNISDPAMRRRILTWASQCFLAEPLAESPAAGAAPTPAPAADATLAVDSLGDLFATAAPAVDDSLTFEAPAAAPAAQPPVKSLVNGFVKDFQRLVVEWQGA